MNESIFEGGMQEELFAEIQQDFGPFLPEVFGLGSEYSRSGVYIPLSGYARFVLVRDIESASESEISFREITNLEYALGPEVEGDIIRMRRLRIFKDIEGFRQPTAVNPVLDRAEINYLVFGQSLNFRFDIFADQIDQINSDITQKDEKGEDQPVRAIDYQDPLSFIDQRFLFGIISEDSMSWVHLFDIVKTIEKQRNEQ